MKLGADCRMAVTLCDHPRVAVNDLDNVLFEIVFVPRPVAHSGPSRPSAGHQTIDPSPEEDSSMRCRTVLALMAFCVVVPKAPAYIEAPYSLGQVCHESTNIVLVEVTKVNKDKKLIIYKKVQDLKGKHPQNEIKHNIGQRGHHEREWRNVMAWAEVGKKAVFFHNGNASVTCIDTYWYQCYREDQWWGMSHAEPFLLRTYFGKAERLAVAVAKIMAKQEVVVPCLANGNNEALHQRKGKVQQLKASLKRLNYDAKRDFVAFGAGDDGVELKTVVLLAQSTAGWKFLPAKDVAALGDRWREPSFDDKGWRTGKAPVGYGQDEIAKRKGTIVKEEGVPFVFRRQLEVQADLLNHKGVTFHMGVASDDSALVYVNGTLVDRDPVEDHDFKYWNREIEIQPKHFKAGRNVIAVFVKNHKGSHDIYLDMELTAQFALPAQPLKVAAKAPTAAAPGQPAPKAKPVEDKERPGALTVDKAKRIVTVECAIAPRKLPNLADVYPIEVIACYPAPRGQKAHETVVTFTGVKPSSVHKALEQLGLKAGKPAVGAGKKAEGPELKIFLEFTRNGKVKRLPIEQTMVDRKTQKPIGTLKWHFTGSVMKQPDPEKNDKVYGSDVTGTLITLLPVTEAVIQSNLKAEDEPAYKLETNKAVLPKEGSPAKLVIEVK